MTQKHEWDRALQDAINSISIRPSLTGYISKGIALCGTGHILDARVAFDVASMYTDQDSQTMHFLLLIKAIALFNAGQHGEANLLLKELVAGCPNADTRVCHIIEAYIHVSFSLGLHTLYDDTPHVDPGLVFSSISVDANSRGIQEICWNHKGQVAKCDHREYRPAEFQISRSSESGNSVDALFEGLDDQMQVWMSHSGQPSVMPSDFHVIGWTSTAPYATITHNSKSVYGIQFHPEGYAGFYIHLGGGFWNGGLAVLENMPSPPSHEEDVAEEEEWEREATSTLETLGSVLVEDIPTADHAFHVSQLAIILD
ncbi:hypothetical protein BD769DRAFT_1734393 [Suillus cothurnatus]|nr:hypothetical protein BD769DRAFT_1734393 [Suillus cothurnatus]